MATTLINAATSATESDPVQLEKGITTLIINAAGGGIVQAFLSDAEEGDYGDPVGSFYGSVRHNIELSEAAWLKTKLVDVDISTHTTVKIL